MYSTKQDVASARRMARIGYSVQEITETLIEAGIDEREAARLAGNAVSMVERKLRKQGIIKVIAEAHEIVRR